MSPSIIFIQLSYRISPEDIRYGRGHIDAFPVALIYWGGLTIVNRRFLTKVTHNRLLIDMNWKSCEMLSESMTHVGEDRL